MELTIVRIRNIFTDKKLKWDKIESYLDKIPIQGMVTSLNQTLGHRCFGQVQMKPKEKPGIYILVISTESLYAYIEHASVDSWIRLLGINEIESDWYPWK